MADRDGDLLGQLDGGVATHVSDNTKVARADLFPPRQPEPPLESSALD